MRHDAGHRHAWLERGDLKARQGQYSGVITDYDQAIHLDPRNARAYVNRSLAKSELGWHDDEPRYEHRAVRQGIRRLARRRPLRQDAEREAKVLHPARQRPDRVPARHGRRRPGHVSV